MDMMAWVRALPLDDGTASVIGRMAPK
jgi:hypothetical protein